MDRARRNLLLALIRENGSVPIVVVDVDFFARFESHVGADPGTAALRAIRDVVIELSRTPEVHSMARDRLFIAAPALSYEEAVILGERTLDRVRELAIPCLEDVSPSERLTVSVAVTCLDSAVDVTRFDSVVDDLLRDAKSTGGDVVVRDRSYSTGSGRRR